jgi:Mrp family chromosome partitioning ATPase
MVNYYDILRRSRNGQAPLWNEGLDKEETVIEPDSNSLGALAPIPVLTLARTPYEVSRTRALQVLNERVAPLTGVGQSVRMLVTGCRPGDGASTVAMGLALDLSQRMGLRTLLVDAHLRKPELHRMFPPVGLKSPTLLLTDQFVVRSSIVPRLELASCLPMTAGALLPGEAEEYEALLVKFALAVVDLGVVRLDGRLLGLARPTDPIVVVTRYGSTERDELAITVAALKAASRSVAGVIINGVPELPPRVRGWAKVFRGDGNEGGIGYSQRPYRAR